MFLTLGVTLVSAKIGGQAGVKLRSKRLTVLGRSDIAGVAPPNVLYKRSGNGIYSQGHVEMNVDDVIDNSFGVIHGASFAIVAPLLINRAGYIKAIDPSLGSSIRASIKNIREEEGTYSYTVNEFVGTYKGGSKCNRCDSRCNGSPFAHHAKQVYRTYETSNEGLIVSQGPLQLTYDYLDMIASRIVCGGDLTFVSGGWMITHTPRGEITEFLGRSTATPRNGHKNYVLVKERFQADLGDADMTCAFTARDISIRAAQAVFRSLGIQQDQRGTIVNLSRIMRGPDAENVYEEVDGTVHLDLPFHNPPIPNAVVLLGKGAHKGVEKAKAFDTQATFGALHHVMGAEFFTLYRGVSALGMKLEDMAIPFINMVRGHKDTRTDRRAITAGDKTQEVEVLSNEVITPEYLMKSGIVGMFFEFTQNIHALEAERQAQIDAAAAKRTVDAMFVVPPSVKHDGFTATDGNCSVVTAVGDNSVFTNARGRNVALVSERGKMTFGSTVERHGDGENFHDELTQASAEAEETLKIQGQTEVLLQAANTGSGVRTDITAVAGAVVDEAVATTTQRVDRHRSKKSETDTTTIDIHQNVSSHASAGVVNIHGATGVLQEGVKLVNAVVTGPVVEQLAVHDQHIVKSVTTSSRRGGWFSAAARKSASSSSVSSIARGCTMSGQSFIALARDKYRAVAPTYAAVRSDITAPRVEIETGVSRAQAQSQSTSQGAMWTKTRVSSESHTTHVNPNFEGNVHIHSPDVIVERVRGSAAFAKLFSDSAVAYVDKDDQHHSTSSTQKRLSAGFALISKLAVGLVVGVSTGGFGLTGVQAAMVNAGFGSLCGDAAVCLVENGGDPARAIQAMGRNGTALNIARAMATAGLVDGISSAAGVKTGFETGVDGKLIERTFTDYAQKAAIQSAVNTVLAVGIDRQDFKQALLQGMASAAVNTAASFGAGQIGGMYRINAIDPVVHKALHAALGAASGATTAAILGGDVRLAALSGATGAFVAETVAEMLKPDATQEAQQAIGKKMTKQEFKDEFMAKAQRSTHWANFAAAVGAFGIGLDAGVAYGAAYNATAHNSSQCLAILCEAAATNYEIYQAIYAVAAACGLKGLLDSLQISSEADGSYGFNGTKYTTLQEVLLVVKAMPLLMQQVMTVEFITNLMEMDPDAGKPKTLDTPMHEPKPVVLDTPVADPRPVLPGYEADPAAGKSVVEGFAAYDGPSVTVFDADRVDGEARLEIRHKPGTDRRDYERKLTALQDLAARGKLVKTDGAVRDPAVTRDHRAGIIEQAKRQWPDQPERVMAVKERMMDLQADHMHELQLGGLDHASGLSLIDGSINASFGKQIQLQLEKVPVGTKITEVVEKVDE